MKWQLTVKRPANIVDSSIGLWADKNVLGDFLEPIYSQGIITSQKGIISYYVPEEEIEQQINYFSNNLNAIQDVLNSYNNHFQKVQNSLKELEDKVSLRSMRDFFRDYQVFSECRVPTRVIGFCENLPENIIDQVAKLRFSFKEDFTKIRESFYDRILKEISIEIYSKEDSLEFLTYLEILDLLENQNNGKYQKIIEERKKSHLLVLYRQNDDFFVLSNKEAEDFMEKAIMKENLENIKEVKGQIACLGNVKGRVVKMFKVENKDLENGFILVTPMTTPDFVPLMKKVKAIITDEGGLTCHAAILSRELNIPCIIGTKIATQVFNDGDLVEVDANNGVVRKSN
jgi:phosphohistidine swiveling domain-containing protein